MYRFTDFARSLCMGALAVWLLGSCRNSPSEGKGWENVPVYQLHGESLPMPEGGEMRYPYRLAMKGDTLAVTDLHGPEYLVQLFHYPDMEHIASLGRRGNGPKEMIEAENLYWIDNTLWVLDGEKQQFVRFSFNKEKPVVEEHTNLDKSLFRPGDFVPIGNYQFMIPDYTGKCRLCRVDSAGNLLERIGSIPIEDKKILKQSAPAVAQAWRSFVAYHPKSKLLVLTTQLGDVMEIYNLKTGGQQLIVGSQGEPKFEVHKGYGIPIGARGYGNVQITDDAIYALYYGQTFKEIQTNLNKQTLQQGGRQIRVFNHQGKLLHIYQLEHHISGFILTDNATTLLGVDVNIDTPIVRYKLPNQK